MQLKSKQWIKGVLSFWSWNDKLDLNEIGNQLQGFKDAGLSGFFIHARGGLLTPYMGEEWMDAVSYAIQAAKAIDLEVWLYDEDAWPSGFCGGLVPRAGIEHQQKWLTWEQIPAGQLTRTSRTIAIYEKRSGQWKRMEPEADPSSYESDSEYLHVYFEANPYYSDLMNEETVQLFIQQTHEKYKERFGHEFGTTIRGFFTDEPQYAADQYPWTLKLPQLFQSMYGYDLLDELPALLLGQQVSIRHDYWKLISHQMVNSYMKQIGMWCENNNLAQTGHVAGEDTLFYQMKLTAGAMPHYEWMHMPGIDHLGRRITRPVLLKQVTSAAAQMGRTQVLSEMFGCSGWTVNFADLKWIAEWQLSQGVNVQCQHLAAYSLRGARKRDYPPALSCQQPWWPQYDAFNRYFEKLYGWISQGEREPQVLLLHPLSSAWCAYKPTKPDELWELDRRFGDMTELLMDMGIDFDYGDEGIMERYGVVNGDSLRIGAMSYRVVLIPSLVSLERTTYALLQRFAAAGGKIVQCGTSPSCVDGRENAELVSWWEQHVQRIMPTEKTLTAVLDRHQLVRVISRSGSRVRGIYSRVRREEGSMLYFLANSSRTDRKEGIVHIPGEWDLKEINHRQGLETAVVYWHAVGDTYWTIKLDGGESVCIEAARREEGALPASVSSSGQLPYRRTKLRNHWTLDNELTNVLTLDKACYRRADQPNWSGPLPLSVIQSELQTQGADAEIQLKFSFQLDGRLDVSSICVVLEDWERVELHVNEALVQCDAPGGWVDACFQAVPVGDYLIGGRNDIVIRRGFRSTRAAYLDDEDAFETERNRYVPLTELESIYLLGSFAVSPVPGHGLDRIPGSHRLSADDFIIGPLPKHADLSDLTPQGFWFYSGTVSLTQQFDLQAVQNRRYSLQLEVPPDAVIVQVRINGIDAGSYLWSPYELDISAFVREGANDIQLMLTSGLRNTFGPHHYFKGEVGFVGPSQFHGVKGWEDLVLAYNTPDRTWSDSYHVVSFGLGSAPVLVEYDNDEEAPR
ncbi:glycosyl hydrolase [Paenibacillus mendelii]|uniref:Glycosyl hydrolase n=1 Tax=Paenibacillus mendelii TaxID=206163 RepID=A0ABV6JC25_9BACL|nr:glycosyl hydrolase [Paenibacillus mendelii]MCQ6562973.1 glycosyl hydrolase [Paenibacillus mendelii]